MPVMGIHTFVFYFTVLLSFIIFIFIILTWPVYENREHDKTFRKIPKTVPKHNFSISRAHVISMHTDNTHVIDLSNSIAEFLHVRNISIFSAINGTFALQNGADDLLSPYTKYLMITGRHDHMQLSSPGMLGCLLSHVHLWNTIQPNETIAIFEEDAYVDMTSAMRMHTLSRDVVEHGIQWDVVLLESGHNMIASGKWFHIGELAANCSYQKSNKEVCTWYGTRGYLITHQGAQHLLRYVYPISVQVDSLMGLVASFSPGFRMYWTRKDIAHLKLFHVTGVWDACIKCFLPASPIPYVLVIMTVLLACCRFFIVTASVCKVTRNSLQYDIN